ncbi:MAG TPA: C40 family peptidase [Chitinophagaceae bacterium]|nr:C40 family peptidase [Chitinophagaceae bacterium]
MLYAVCCVPVSPLRQEPSHLSEIKSQLLFGECCKVLLTEKDWFFIQGQYDEYEGWCQASHITEILMDDYLHARHDLTADWVNTILYNGHPMKIPFGSSLTAMINGKAQWKRNTIQFDGKFQDLTKCKTDPKTIRDIAFTYLNTPYLWGGKSVFGTDCSGYSQMVFKFLGIKLKRDAWQQAEQGNSVDFLQEAKLGDLAFFDNAEGKIIHVGILLNEGEIVHAAGKVRIDKVDTQGIINTDTGMRTHNLRLIKRYF